MIADVTRQTIPRQPVRGACPFPDASRPPDVPAAEGTTRSPGPGGLPEGDPDILPGPVQEAAGPGDLPPHWLTYITVQALYAHIQAILETDPARTAIQAVNRDR